MPYIASRTRREAIRNGATPLNAGELNFAVTSLVLDYVQASGKSYQHINDAVGALECAKLELYRRLAAPYEDEKIRENGDVYP